VISEKWKGSAQEDIGIDKQYRSASDQIGDMLDL